MSELYKVALTVNNQKFGLIVSAAMLKHAQTIPLVGTGSSANDKQMAIWAMKNPLAPEYSMIALVASSDTVMQKTIMNENETVDISGVTDDDVMAVVAAKWGVVGSKYVGGSTPAAAGNGSVAEAP